MPVIQTITASTGGAAGSVTSVAMSVPTGFVVTGSPITTSGTLAVSFASGYSLPTTASQSNWDSAYTFTSTFPTGTALQLLRYNSAGTALEFFTANFLSNPFSALGDTLYSNAAGAPLRLAGNTTATLKFLSQTGDGFGSSAAPIWLEITPTTIGAVPTSRTLTINGTAYDLTANRSWDTITSLTGEATASGTGAVSVTLTNSAVIGKLLTGLNITGGTIAATDTILQAFGKLQNQVTALVGGVMYKGTWNASTNSPTITSSSGNKGDYYVVSVAGSTNIDGITSWNIGDWIIFNGSVWEKVDNTDLVSSVNGYTGAVSLTTSDIAEGTNLYYTDARARLSLSLTTTGSSGAATYSNTTGVFNIPNYTIAGLGGVPTSRQLQINNVAYDLSADRSWSVGTVTSVAALTIGTTGTDITSSVADGTTTPVITLNIPTASASNRGALSSADWSTFNSKMSNVFTSLGDLVYSNAAGAPVRRAGNTTTTKMFLSQTGNGTSSAAPQWEAITTTTLNAVPTSRTITINDVVFDLTADRSWSVGDFGTW
jgi:hypothetical protein